MANVGDSRGIVIRAIPPESPETAHLACETDPLTRDHKPDDADEAKRILEWNGRIDSYRD